MTLPSGGHIYLSNSVLVILQVVIVGVGDGVRVNVGVIEGVIVLVAVFVGVKVKVGV